MVAVLAAEKRHATEYGMPGKPETRSLRHIQCVFSWFFGLFCHFPGFRAWRSPSGRSQSGDAQNVVRGSCDREVETHTLQATETDFPHATDGLHPAKDRLDATANVDAHGMARMAGRAAIDGRSPSASWSHGGHVLVPQHLDELPAIIPIPPKTGPRSPGWHAADDPAEPVAPGTCAPHISSASCSYPQTLYPRIKQSTFSPMKNWSRKLHASVKPVSHCPVSISPLQEYNHPPTRNRHDFSITTRGMGRT